MKELTSVKNPCVQAARELCTARGRAEQNAFLLDGEHMVREALAICPQRVRTVFVDSTRAKDYAALLSCVPNDAEVYTVPAHVLGAIAQVQTPQGVAAVCEKPEAVALSSLGERLLLLENVQDPGNVGTMLRTLDAAGFDGCMITKGCAEPYSPKALRATMGSVFRVPLCFEENAAESARTLAASGYAVIGAALGGEPFYERGKLPTRVCVLIGNEGAGLTADALAACTHCFELPMRGGAESLNAGIAAALFMYELINRG